MSRMEVCMQLIIFVDLQFELSDRELPEQSALMAGLQRASEKQLLLSSCLLVAEFPIIELVCQ